MPDEADSISTRPTDGRGHGAEPPPPVFDHDLRMYVKAKPNRNPPWVWCIGGDGTCTNRATGVDRLCDECRMKRKVRKLMVFRPKRKRLQGIVDMDAGTR